MILGTADPVRQALAFRDLGARRVVITRGDQGAIVVSESLRVRVGTYSVPYVDGTGGGDAFDSGYIAGLVDGLGEIDCLHLASALGASCVRSVGTTAGTFTRAEADAFIAARDLPIDADLSRSGSDVEDHLGDPARAVRNQPEPVPGDRLDLVVEDVPVAVDRLAGDVAVRDSRRRRPARRTGRKASAGFPSGRATRRARRRAGRRRSRPGARSGRSWPPDLGAVGDDVVEHRLGRRREQVVERSPRIRKPTSAVWSKISIVPMKTSGDLGTGWWQGGPGGPDRGGRRSPPRLAPSAVRGGERLGPGPPVLGNFGARPVSDPPVARARFSMRAIAVLVLDHHRGPGRSCLRR